MHRHISTSMPTPGATLTNSTRYPHFLANATQASKYAVCKHGLHHEDKCGYAHKLRTYFHQHADTRCYQCFSSSVSTSTSSPANCITKFRAPFCRGIQDRIHGGRAAACTSIPAWSVMGGYQFVQAVCYGHYFTKQLYVCVSFFTQVLFVDFHPLPSFPPAHP